MYSPLIRLLEALLPVAIIVFSAVASAQPGAPIVRARTQRLGEASWQLDVRFEMAVRYVSHTPSLPSKSFEIELAPVALHEADRLALERRETVNLPTEAGLGLERLTFDGSGSRPILRMEFLAKRTIAVRVGSDPRTLQVRVSSSRPRDRDRVLLETGRSAMTDADLDRAVATFEVLLDPDTETDPEIRRAARELLAVARERNGQPAHAIAEYEAYLAEHPEGPDADRVRQRLRSLRTALEGPREPLRTPRAAESMESPVEFYGSVGTSYLRTEEFSKDIDRVYDSVAYADLDFTAAYAGETLQMLGIASGSYRYDFERGGTARDARVGTLLVDLRDDYGNRGTIGRQSPSNGGVLGRFDGARIAIPIIHGLEVSALGGFALASSAAPRVSFDRPIFGLSTDVGRLFDAVDLELYAVGQLVDDRVDRIAIGGQLRYVSQRYFALAYLDYDVYFNSLNTFVATGSYRLERGGDVHGQLDVRNAPVLTLENALQGQTADDLDELADVFSTSEMRDLAKDRTARIIRGSVGSTYPFLDTWTVAGDVALNTRSKTPSSGGVPGMDASGIEAGVSLRLTKSRLLVDGGTGTAELRTFIGNVFDLYGLRVATRFPLWRQGWIEPRLLIDQRSHKESGDDVLRIAPSLRFESRNWIVNVECQIGLSWQTYSGRFDREDELGLLAEIGLRYDF